MVLFGFEASLTRKKLIFGDIFSFTSRSKLYMLTGIMYDYTENSNGCFPIRQRMLGSLSCVLILFYLGFHTVSGERGVFALLRERHRLATLQEELQEVKSKRASIEKKVSRLGNGSVDLDLLDEQARRLLGNSGKNEVVLFLDR